ncbi:hypothetical protein J6590_028817 [Homalodisca vitripennis]|nr:hypothetical protein J6590_028817 [Homalodisca vitripennis]
MAERSKTLDFGSEFEIAQPKRLSTLSCCLLGLLIMRPGYEARRFMSFNLSPARRVNQPRNRETIKTGVLSDPKTADPDRAPPPT